VRNRPWLQDRVHRPGGILITKVAFEADSSRKAKFRPVVVLDEVDINSSGTVRLIPLSTSSWGDDRITIEADDDNRLPQDSSAVPSAVFSLDASDVIIRPPKGNVSKAILNELYEAVEDVQG